MVIGGDGTLRAAQEIADAATARGVVLSVVGVPKGRVGQRAAG